ncbi:MAG: signal peptidase I [Desulfurococcaceae archaeon]
MDLMNIKIVLITALIALMYYLVYFSRPVTGILFYYLQVVIYLIIILLSWTDVREYIRFNYFTTLITLFTFNYILAYFVLGSCLGFGLTPYSTSLPGVVINLIYTASKICALEFYRILLVNAIDRRHRQLAIHLTTITVWFLTWFPYPLLSLKLSTEGFKQIFRYLIPSFISNGFSTYIALNHGLIPSLIYNMIPQIFFKTMPFIPLLDWFIEGGFNALIPLVGYAIAMPYTKFPRRIIRKMRRENKSISKLPLYFVTIFILITILQVYAGLRFYVVSSGSMNPTLNIGDLVIVCNTCKDLNTGDIIAYISKWGVIVHRVVEVDENQNYVITKGDANSYVDPDPVPFKYVVGKVLLRIPALGYPAILIHRIEYSTLSYMTLALLLIVMVALFLVRRINV